LVAWRELDRLDLLASTSPRHDRRLMREGGPTREAPEYAPRRPETTILYRVVQHQLETWLGNARTSERSVPRFVERELRAFLDCGILANGFLRLHCDACGLDRLVPGL
jgi:hypothetical protein